MVIFIVHIFNILTYKSKRNSPVPTDVNCPRSGSISSQLVKPKSWKVHVLWLSSSMKATKYQTKPFRVLGLNSRSLSGFEKALQALMLKVPNHKNYRNPTGNGCQPYNN